MTSQSNNNLTVQKLTQDIKLFTEFIKSLLLTLPKQGRRLLTMVSLQKTKNTMLQYLPNQYTFKFNDFQQYTQLLSKQIYSHINKQVYDQLLTLHSKLRSFSFQQKVKNKQNQLKSKENNQKTINPKDKKNQKPSQNYTLPQLLNELQTIKKHFYQLWRQDYFLILNYRMAITAKQLQKWTYIAQNKIKKQQIIQDVNQLFN